ncbi:uncharacterized protein LOC118185869 [Stegodyphus dumicola]|uniref:uncharacterized protein LOC118185869 n=1 Tax=Stegodyphus dumicola TaxID=202533 RepID=UPI0015A8C71A|nr:uncharacterized protein LOC118185869 [Stegodyphus dumicola]
MLLKAKVSLTCLLLLLTTVNELHGHFMMKAIMHGAAMGMMMRPRFLPVPIPVPQGMISNVLSGIRNMYQEQQQQIIVVQQPKRTQPKIIFIQAQNECCNDW